MWKTKLCMSTSVAYKIPIEEQIRLFKKIGFEGFFTCYDGAENIRKYRQVADEIGMIYQSVHAPFLTMDKMWERSREADEAVSLLSECVRACGENDVPIMVAHVYIGFDKDTPTEEGLENFGKVIAVAEECGVKIAFENTEGEGYLAAIMERFKTSPAVGFCWDTGHEMCYNHSQDMLALYGDRLIATHINDNLGIKDFDGKITPRDDLHLLPFDGVADWDGIVRRLNKYGYDGILTFELKTKSQDGRCENEKYAELPIERYIAAAYERACRVATLKQRNK